MGKPEARIQRLLSFDYKPSIEMLMQGRPLTREPPKVKMFTREEIEARRKLATKTTGEKPHNVLGPLAGLCVLLPYVGVILSTAPAVFVAFLGTDEPFLALKVVLFYSVVQFLEGNVLTPFIVGSRVRLHPLAVLVAFLFWGILWGLPGAILAVPLTATLKVLMQRYVWRSRA